VPVVRLRIYNAMSDAGDPCAECARWDLTELPQDDASTVRIPNPACTCAGGCDCYWTWVGRIVGDVGPADLRPSKRLC
jgi:hypothetical protein